MTERASPLGKWPLDKIAVSGLVNASLRPGGSISIAFSDSIVHVVLDQSGDWTITTGLSLSSDRLATLSKRLEELGFFQATEQGGMVYHLWTSALEEGSDHRNYAEKTLLSVLKNFQSRQTLAYIN